MSGFNVINMFFYYTELFKVVHFSIHFMCQYLLMYLIVLLSVNKFLLVFYFFTVS